MYSDMNELKEAAGGIVGVLDEGRVEILDEGKVRGDFMDGLVRTAVFAEAEARDAARWLIRRIAVALGSVPSSIQSLYEAMGKEEVEGFTVPAINIRGMTYDVARAVFRAAGKGRVGPVLFEIARSEIGYTMQRPAEYTAVVLAAAVRESFTGPIFLQGDHYQVNLKKYQADADKEVDTVKDLIRESIDAGFYNIDIDTSTLVDLDKPTIKEQQELNYSIAADLTALIRELEPEGITISVGGEIGEVGGKNSTVEELEGFMDNYVATLKEGLTGISKISVQTGTAHGGVVLPDGSIADVNIDFDTLEKLSDAARIKYGMSGAVQHGASTLPDEAFDRFPQVKTAEIHLATGFQNIIYESENFPGDLRTRIYDWLRTECAGEKKEGQTDEQFIYKTRKKGFGPFKKEIWDIPEGILTSISNALEGKFDFLFNKLSAKDTVEDVQRCVKLVDVVIPPPQGLL